MVLDGLNGLQTLPFDREFLAIVASWVNVGDNPDVLSISDDCLLELLFLNVVLFGPPAVILIDWLRLADRLVARAITILGSVIDLLIAIEWMHFVLIATVGEPILLLIANNVTKLAVMVLWHNLSWMLQIMESLSKASKAVIVAMTSKATIEV